MASRILLVKAESPERTRFEEALYGLVESGETPEVATAAGGWEALAHAGHQPFDLVIADLVLPKPGLSGAETLLRIGEIQPAARSILLSDHCGTRDLLDGVADVFLTLDSDRAAFLTKLLHSATRLLAGAEGGPRLVDEVTTVADERTAAGSPSAGRLIAGKYLLGAELGRGGMGLVYEAEDTFIGRPVAVKLLHVRATQARDSLARRMRREVMIAGRLDHPNIVTVFDAGFEGDEMFFVMELIEGQTLRELLRKRRTLPRDEAIGVLLQTLDAVSYAHGRQVVHRDLKPENILLGPQGRVKVVDFGVAKLVSIASSSGVPRAGDAAPRHCTTTKGAVIGTKGYMAPEQRIGEEVDHRADLYALGVVLCEMLHGSASPAPAPCDRRLRRIVERATALLPDERYPNGQAFAAALEDLERPVWRRWWPWR